MVHYKQLTQHTPEAEAQGACAAQATSRVVLATSIHDLLLCEMGQDVDVALMLGPQEYARAVLSLCRSCGSPALARLARQFEQQSLLDARSEIAAQQQRLGNGSLRATFGLLARRSAQLLA
ncbi:MAG: hypothetical protein RIQ60_1577 [Pseudomonadota bacterium]|jgi:hypothetical protein